MLSIGNMSDPVKVIQVLGGLPALRYSDLPMRDPMIQAQVRLRMAFR